MNKDKKETKIVIDLLDYGNERYNEGCNDGTVEGLRAARELLWRVSGIGAKSRGRFAKLIVEYLQENDLYKENSPFVKELARSIKRAKIDIVEKE